MQVCVPRTWAAGRQPVPRSRKGQASVAMPTQGISMPHPDTHTVDWVMFPTPGFIQDTSRWTVSLDIMEVTSCVVVDRPPLHDAGRPDGAVTAELLAVRVGGPPVAAQHVRRLGDQGSTRLPSWKSLGVPLPE